MGKRSRSAHVGSKKRPRPDMPPFSDFAGSGLSSHQLYQSRASSSDRHLAYDDRSYSPTAAEAAEPVREAPQHHQYYTPSYTYGATVGTPLSIVSRPHLMQGTGYSRSEPGGVASRDNPVGEEAEINRDSITAVQGSADVSRKNSGNDAPESYASLPLPPPAPQPSFSLPEYPQQNHIEDLNNRLGNYLTDTQGHFTGYEPRTAAANNVLHQVAVRVPGALTPPEETSYYPQTIDYVGGGEFAAEEHGDYDLDFPTSSIWPSRRGHSSAY